MAKAIKKQVLGRGLSAILKETQADLSQMNAKTAKFTMGSSINVPLEFIEVNPFQPRTQFNENSLKFESSIPCSFVALEFKSYFPRFAGVQISSS